jgi:[acyl-carrier-protein] S-malonyltransferase
MNTGLPRRGAFGWISTPLPAERGWRGGGRLVAFAAGATFPSFQASILVAIIMSLALLFAGQGAQKVGMGKSLYDQSPAARALYDEAKSILGWDLAKISFDGPESELTETRVCQPALFVHGLAVLAALQERGELPAAGCALGLSLGEVTACTAAGVCDFATGLRIVAERGRLMQQACERTAGAMAAIVGEDRSRVESICAEHGIEAANFNAPGQIIISGDKTKVEAAVANARERGMKKVIVLKVAGAYHSRLMESARAAFAEYLAGATLMRPLFPVFTNTTGQTMSEPAAIKAALAKQLVSPVLWEDCLRGAASAGATEFWELGPGGVLAGLVRRTDKTWRVKSFSEFADISA